MINGVFITVKTLLMWIVGSSQHLHLAFVFFQKTALRHVVYRDVTRPHFVRSSCSVAFNVSPDFATKNYVLFAKVLRTPLAIRNTWRARGKYIGL